MEFYLDLKNTQYKKNKMKWEWVHVNKGQFFLTQIIKWVISGWL